tara:strand:+ start:6522 stop:8288 length:1767 start_codon:yes stop_codon:yes gene_type:complete
MTDPITGTNNALVTDLQGQAQSSGLIEVFEVYLADSNIGGAGEDKLYFHDGRNGTSEITWYSLINDNDFGSSNSAKYSQRTYTALPIESDGWEIRGTGSLPRPTVRFGNINAYWNTYLTDFDDLVGAKVIRRRTLEKYLSTTPPVEFNRDVFYVERKVTEDAVMVEFELASAMDVEGIKLPRRSIIAARCPWKYKDTAQGGCDWPNDSRPTIDGTEHTLYFDKDDNRISLDLAAPGATEYTAWGRQDLLASRTGNLYAAVTGSPDGYDVDDYVEYPRPIGSLYPITKTQYTATNELEITFYTSGDADQFTAGSSGASGNITAMKANDDWIILKGLSTTAGNYKNVPLKVKSDGGSGKVKVQVDTSHTSTLGGPVSAGSFVVGTAYKIASAGNTNFTLIGAANNNVGTAFTASGTGSGTGTADTTIGYVQACRATLYRCTAAHSITTGDGIDDLIKPTNISYWEFGDVCGKRLNSCAKRFGHVPNSGKVDSVHIKDTNGVLQQGSGYTSVPTVVFTGGGGTGAAATATVASQKVTKFTVTNGGQDYTSNPTVSFTGGGGSGAAAEAKVKFQTTDNVSLPFGGFPGASLY